MKYVVQLPVLALLSALSCGRAIAQSTTPATPAAPAAIGSDLGNSPQAAPRTIVPDPFKTPPAVPKTVTQKPMRTYQQMLNDLDKQVPPVKIGKPEAAPNFARRKRVYDPQLGRYVTVDPKTRSRRYPPLESTRPSSDRPAKKQSDPRNAGDKDSEASVGSPETGTPMGSVPAANP